MRKLKNYCLLSVFVLGTALTSYGQLAKHPTKFLGNITTYNSVRSDFATYWNQMTPENESKWSSIEGSRDRFNWGGCDNAYNYCKEHNIPFKFHTLVWGSQYPQWMDNLTTEEQYEEIVEWYDAVKERYPDLEYIDVVNEAVKGHAPAPYKNALGGDGVSGYDWIVNAFAMARDRWPDAVLIYNDYNTFQWQINEFIDLVKKIKAAGAPIDAVGCQSHDLNDMSGANFKSALERIHNETGLPVYITEYDINKADDEVQKLRYQEQIPIMWEADYVHGVTLWGYVFGSTWVNDGDVKGASGIIKDKNGTITERPAFTWLKEYMESDAAINAPNSFVDIDLRSYFYANNVSVFEGDEVLITAKNSCNKATSTVDTIRIYDETELVLEQIKENVSNSNTIKWVADKLGKKKYRMVAVTSTGEKVEKEVEVTVEKMIPRECFNGTPIVIPGTLELEEFDKGSQGIAYNDSDNENEGGAFRTDVGVDIVSTSDGYAIGYTATGEWLEYTVKVENEQIYEVVAVAASGLSGSGFKIKLNNRDLTDKIEVPKTADNDWGVYTEIVTKTKFKMPKGEYPIRVEIVSPYCNIDKLIFREPTTSIVENVEDGINGLCDVYSVMGVNLGSIEIVDNDLTRLSDMFETGIYIIRCQQNGKTQRVMIK